MVQGLEAADGSPRTVPGWDNGSAECWVERLEPVGADVEMRTLCLFLTFYMHIRARGLCQQGRDQLSLEEPLLWFRE